MDSALVHGQHQQGRTRLRAPAFQSTPSDRKTPAKNLRDAAPMSPRPCGASAIAARHAGSTSTAITTRPSTSCGEHGPFKGGDSRLCRLPWRRQEPRLAPPNQAKRQHLSSLNRHDRLLSTAFVNPPKITGLDGEMTRLRTKPAHSFPAGQCPSRGEAVMTLAAIFRRVVPAAAAPRESKVESQQPAACEPGAGTHSPACAAAVCCG